MDNFDLRKYLSEGKLLKESLGSDPKYYVKYTTLDGKEVKSELMSKREAIYKERDLVDSGVKKSSVYKFTKNIDLNGKPYVIDLELDKEIDYRKDEKGRPIDENKLLKENNEFVDSIKKSDLKIVDQYLKIKKESQDLEHDVSDFLEDFSKNEVEELDRDLPNGLQYDLIEIYKEQDWDPDNSPYSSPESAEENDIGETMLDYDFADNPNLSPPGDPGKYIFPLGPLSHL